MEIDGNCTREISSEMGLSRVVPNCVVNPTEASRDAPDEAIEPRDAVSARIENTVEPIKVSEYAERDMQTSAVKKAKRRNRRGSLLRRNDDRIDHFRTLFLKRQISERRLFFSHKVEQAAAGIDDCVPMPETNSDDSYLVEEMKDEENAEGMKYISAKVMEIEKLMYEYRQHLQGLGRFPLEVRLSNVSYTVPIDMNEMKIKTVYNSSFLYPMWKYICRKWKGEKKMKDEVVQFPVLSNVNLLLQPGKQYLVLGAPGSGKSTLLKLIAGLIHPRKGETLLGDIEYNGRKLSESDEFFIENAFIYIDQLDKHAPRLTVEETFEFAYQCLTGGKFVREKLTGEAALAVERADKEHVQTRLTLTSLGLTEVANTYVGDETIRGVSGGQRRRVTVGEMLSSAAPVMCGDEISTGLDAASTYDMIQVILHYGRYRKQTNVFALLQPSPETVSLFDDVIVLAEGQIIYAGPIELVEDYFADIGFKAPPFTDVADFLQIITTVDGACLYDPPDWIRVNRPKAPTIAELATIFQESEQGKLIVSQLKQPSTYVWKESDKGSLHGISQVSDLSKSEAVRRKYANLWPRSTWLLFRKFLILWIRDKRVIIAGVVKNVLMGVSVGGVFFNTVDPISIQGCLFQAGLFIMLGAMQSSSGLLQDRVIYYKHTDANFYSAWPFVFGRVFAQLPQTTFDTFTFGTILYYMVGLADRDSGSNFMVYITTLLLFALLMNQQMSVFASFANGGQMQVFGACTLLAMMLFGGFIVPPNTIPTYYQWIYWWNPFAWSYRALVVNEFYSERWPDPESVLATNGFIGSRGRVFGKEWIAYSYYFMFVYFLGCCVITAFGLTYVRNSEKRTAPKRNSETEAENSEREKFEIAFDPVTLSFQDLHYEVTGSTSNERLLLLNEVNGILRPGQMCALMGSSGAGKTTLMDVIALRKRSGIISGEVRMNGWPQEAMAFRRCSGYVEQFDVQTPELTVHETVLFSARLRLDPDLVQTEDEREAFVDSVIAELELTNIENALVGTDESGGLSFEQKKRLSIAVELAASPSIIFLDEPTSGLDGRSALLVVKALRRIADGGRTICATIHQPSCAVFSMFDELLLMKRGGRVVYHGHIGIECEAVVSYFESRGASPIALGENAANWMLRVITSDEMSDLPEQYLKSNDYQRLQQEIEELKNHTENQVKIEFDSEFASTGGRRRDLVNRRLGLIYWRSPAYNLARILVSLIMAVLLSSVFLSDTLSYQFEEVDMRARLSVIFLSFIITGIMAVLSVIPVMERIRNSFYRHRDAGMYDSKSLGLALGVAEKYFIIFSSLIFSVVFLGTSDVDKGITGLAGFWGFFTFNFAIYSYVGQLFVCVVQSTSTALILSSVFIGLNNFFAGLIVRPQYMVGGFYALPYYISPSHYVYEGLVIALYAADNRPVLAVNGSPFNEYLIANNDCVVGEAECIGTVQQFVYLFFGGEFRKENTLRNVLILGFILCLSRLLTWVALKKVRFG